MFNGKNYHEWFYSAQLAIGWARRLGYIDRTQPSPLKNDRNYLDWKLKNMLIVNWILIAMKSIIAASSTIVRQQKELQDSISKPPPKRNHARIYQLTRDMARLKQKEMCPWILGDYGARLRGMWRELALYKPMPAGQEEDIEDQDQHIYELLGDVNHKYKIGFKSRPPSTT